MAEPELTEAEFDRLMREAMAGYAMVRSNWQRYVSGGGGFWTRPRARALRAWWRRVRG